MWLSLNIISKMVDLDGIEPEELALKLTLATAEIDGIEYINQHFKSIYTAKINSVTKHPDADKLTLCDVTTGSEDYKVVCGASNHKAGDIVALATIGTKFSDEFQIKKSKIRGQESFGMLCSEKELGFADESSGILIFPEDTTVGMPLSELYADWVDILLEIDNKSITHRPDLWSHLGFAREIGALYSRPVADVVDYSLADTFKDQEQLEVSIENPEASPRYSGLVVRGIQVKESPEWLKAAVTSIGMRPINNIVDITNYVMAELGEPMHAFDREKLNGTTIYVKMAQEGQKMTTLDEQEHILTAEDIVIADGSGAVALGGVMGGGNSEISDTTTEIVLEAANFNAVNIRKTAHRCNLRTEAAIRFEKSLSPELTTMAILRCYELIKESCPEAEAVSKIADAYPKKLDNISVATSLDFINKRLGQNIGNDRIIEILTSLDFTVENDNGNLNIAVPHYRATKDVSIPEDIVEEVGRIYGYDNIEPAPPLVPCSTPEVNTFRQFERAVKNLLSLDHHMFEISGYSFVGEALLDKLEINEDRELRLKNTLSREQDRLRRSLVPDMIKGITLNQKYNDRFRIYELGRVYLKDDRQSPDLVAENSRIAGAIFARKGAFGPGFSGAFDVSGRKKITQFYKAKTVVMELFKSLKVPEKNYQLVPVHDNLPPYAHPGRSLRVTIQGKDAGLICELHPKTIENFEINGTAALFDVDIDMLFSTKKTGMQFTELQKFPEVPFELSVIADEMDYAGDIMNIISKSNKQFTTSVDVISIYQGEQIPQGKKSVSLKVVFAAKDRTLESQEIDTFQNKVIKDLANKGYSLR